MVDRVVSSIFGGWSFLTNLGCHIMGESGLHGSLIF